MAGKIKDVITKLNKINDDANRFGLQITTALARQFKTISSTTATPASDSLSVESYVVGREEYVLEIVDKLIAAPPQEKVSVISIVGMGGVGKTTIARTVFNDEKIKKHFGEKIWLSVSFNFDALLLFKMILENLTKEEVRVTCKEVVLGKIQERLSGKSYLLVLDDVWNEENAKWDEFMNPLSNISNVNGNCIVVTTRNEKVASLARTLHTHQLSCLSESQCWSIIKAETFRGKDVPEEFEGIGKRIARRCDGLPLAAKVIGGLLRGKPEEYWYSILENKLSDGNGIKKILMLSYDNLPSLALKKCFAYCSVFPQDYSLERQEMIELWIAEGFLHVENGDDMESVGNENFNHLLQCSLFQDATRDIFGDIVDCKMHDLVHDLACSITKSMHQVRYLALTSTDTNEPNAISEGQMKFLRTMFYEGEIEINMFSNFRCLHVLKLTGWEIREMPYEIKKLIHLRSLDILETEVEQLPDSVSKLYHLQTLSICYNLKKLPNTITNLLSLRHLHTSTLTELPPGIGKLTSLRTLKHYEVRDEIGCRIEELGKLKNLKGELEIKNLEMVKDKEEAELADLYEKPGLFKLILRWNESNDRVGHHKNVLDGLQPHPRLKSLEIDRYGGKNLPLWTMKMAAQIEGHWEAFNNLVEITLRLCKQLEELPMLGHLRCLRFLVLEELSEVRFIGILFYGLENLSIMNIAFPALERLELLEMQELTEWLDVEGATVFPCLKDLRIFRCYKLKNVHCHFPRLEKLDVDDADFSLTNLFSNTCSLQHIGIRSLSGLDSFPDDFFVKNQNLTHLEVDRCPNLMRLVPSSLGGGASLKKLSIWNCENLKELPDDLSTLCNLQELWIIGCPVLKSIPYDVRGQSQGLTSLRTLHISYCKGLTDLPIELLESCTSSLEELTLYDLENLENLGTLIPCIGRMSSLRILAVTDIPKLMIFPAEIGYLGSLRSLEIGGFSESINVVTFNDGLAIILNKCRSLEDLAVHGNEHWDSLPDSIQNLTALQTLYIRGFGIEDMPEWIGNLSSLQSLYIYHCKRLSHLPSQEAMKKLTNLYYLGIDKCPLLKERCSPPSTHGHADSEWHKISHIPNVEIDDEKLPTKLAILL